MNTLRVDGKIFVFGKEKLRIQKYPDTCGRVKKQVQPPWMSNDIKEAMEETDKHLTRARRWNLTEDWLCYRRAKNNTTNLMKKAIDENKGNPKWIWRLLKQLGETGKPLPKITNLNYNGRSVSEPEMIAESLNNFFVESIASSNGDNAEECDYSKLRNFISSRSDSGASYSIPHIFELEVSNIFKSLASNKASGHDSLSPCILKVC